MRQIIFGLRVVSKIYYLNLESNEIDSISVNEKEALIKAFGCETFFRYMDLSAITPVIMMEFFAELLHGDDGEQTLQQFKQLGTAFMALYSIVLHQEVGDNPTFENWCGEEIPLPTDHLDEIIEEFEDSLITEPMTLQTVLEWQNYLERKDHSYHDLLEINVA